MISVWPLSDQVFCCTANWFLCPLGYLLCDRWLQVAVTLCCHLSPRSLGRKEPAVRSPLRLPVAPRLLWQTPKLLWTRYLPPAGGPPRCALWTAAFLWGWGCESWPLRNTPWGVTVAQAVIVMWDHSWLYRSSPLQGSWQWDEQKLGHRNDSWRRLCFKALALVSDSSQ